MHYRFPPHFAFNHDYRLSGPAATVELRSVQKTFSNREAYVVPEYLLFVPLRGQKTFLTTTPLLQSAIESLLPFFMQDTAHHQALIQLKMEELLLHLLSLSAYQAEALGILGDVLFQPRAAYLPLIQACLHTPMTIEAMAQQVGQSPTVFKREFKAAFGLPPARYLQEKRLEHAHLMLLNTAKSVTDIAMETGFDSASHFTQAFKKHYGLTPGTLRKSRPNTP